QPNKRSGNLNFGTLANLLAGGDQGPAVTPGNVESSLLWQRIAAGEMPPPESREIAPLSVSEKQTLRQWIVDGAPWPPDRELGIHEQTPDQEKAREFWSFQKVRRPAVPEPSRARAVGAVDAFLGQRLAAAELNLSPRADAATLLRRVSLD